MMFDFWQVIFEKILVSLLYCNILSIWNVLTLGVNEMDLYSQLPLSSRV